MEDLIGVDRTLFLPLPRLNRFSILRTAEQIHAIERDYDVSIGCSRRAFRDNPAMVYGVNA